MKSIKIVAIVMIAMTITIASAFNDRKKDDRIYHFRRHHEIAETTDNTNNSDQSSFNAITQPRHVEKNQRYAQENEENERAHRRRVELREGKNKEK